MKKVISLMFVMVLFFSMALTGCEKAENTSSADETKTTETEEATQQPTEAPTYNAGSNKYAFIICGAEMRSSAHQAMWNGAEKFAKETGVPIKWFHAETDAEAEVVVTQIIAEGYNVIFSVSGNISEKLLALSKENPNTTFVSMENEVDPEGAANFISATLKAEDPGFIAGYIAAKKTQTNKVALVGATDNYVAQQFEAGFIDGVIYVNKTDNKKVKFAIDYVGTSYDRKGGYAMAEKFYNDGNDVVFTTGGAETGGGAVFAAKTLGKQIITVGNMYYIAPDDVIAAVKKAVDTNTYDVVMGVFTGAIKGGDKTAAGIDSEKVGFISSPQAEKYLGEDLISEIDEISQKLISGEIEVHNKVDAKLKYDQD
ncbi:BMP family ABC transporter substrate-binding protein [Clostridia bacterium]|nr:BMP family ABC transporter substrate-binding protein [Clostridia bacterium]